MAAPVNTNRAKYWFVSGWIALFLMALLWSVDSSMVRLLFGTGVFCFFQYIRLTQWGPRQARKEQASRGRARPDPREQVDELLDEIQRGFKPKFRLSVSKLIAGIFGMMFFGFIILVIVVSASEWDDEYFTYYERAFEHSNKGNYDSAAYYFGLAIQKDPEDPELYVERGNSFMYLNRYDSAVAMFDQALVLNPDHGTAQFNKGYVLFQQGRYRQSIQHTRKVLERNPHDTQAKLLLGDCYYNQQHTDSALYWYRDTYESGYRSAALSHMMAYIYDTRGETSKAVPLYKEALDYDNSISEIYDRLAELLPPEEANQYRTRRVQLDQADSDW